jgi:hypothetical protein
MSDNKPITLFPHVFSTTGFIDHATRCQYLAFLKYIMNWQQVDKPYNTHLDFGQYFAKAQEIVFISYFKRAMSEEQAIQEGVNYLETEFMQRYQDANADEPVKNPTKAVEMLRRYFEECPLEEGDMLPFQLADNDISVEKGLLMELPFKHPETGLPLRLFSKYDRLCFDNNADIVAVVDTKTSGYTAGDTADKIEGTMLKYKMGNQMPQYAVVTNAEENKHLIYGRTVNHGEIHLVLTTQKAAGKKGEAISKKQPFVEKLSFAITDYHQEEWYIAACDLVSDMLERYKKYQETGDVHSFRKSFGHCISKDGIDRYAYEPCFFHRHCTDASWGNIASRYSMVQAIYVKEKDVMIPLVDKRKELGL